MSFTSLDRDELLLAAEGFGVEVAPNVPDEAIVELLEDEGATYSRWLEMRKAAGLDDDEPEVEVTETVVETTVTAPVSTAAQLLENAKKNAKAKGREKSVARKKTQPTDEVIVKMERNNLRYEIFGKVFTKEHPYVVVDVATANKIFAAVDGFRMAHPLEAEQFYA